MITAIPKITYKNFPSQKKDMNLHDNLKHKLTDITGVANTSCWVWVWTLDQLEDRGGLTQHG